MPKKKSEYKYLAAPLFSPFFLFAVLKQQIASAEVYSQV